VFDGKPFDLAADGVAVEFATRRGPNAADDDIVQMVEADPEPGELHVVTSDHELSSRVRQLGAEVISSGVFRQMLGT
jgi:rRNA-processing protein FCF1